MFNFINSFITGVPQNGDFEKSVPSSDNKKQQLEETIKQTAKEKLPSEILPPQTQPSQSNASFFSWIWGGKEKKAEAQDGQEENSSEMNKEKDSGADVQSDFNPSIKLTTSESKGEDASPSSHKELKKVDKIAIAVYEATKGTITTNTWSAWGVWMFAPVVNHVIKSFEGKFNKEASISKAKREMLEELHDSQLIELYDMLSAVIRSPLKEQLDGLEGSQSDFVKKYILPNRKLIVDVIEVNLARGFVNLARQVKQNQNKIPHFDQQPSLVSIISLLSQNIGKNLNSEKLKEIEKKYEKNDQELQEHIKNLFPGIDSHPEMKDSMQKYIQEYLKTKDKARKEEIKKSLFLNLAEKTEEEKSEINHFFDTLDQLHQKQEELYKLFEGASTDILHYFFPKKFADMEVPGILQYERIQKFIYDFFINHRLANFLQDSYQALENNSARNKAWKDELEIKVGAPDLKPVIEAPASLLVAFAKNYIQADPSVMDLTTATLDQLVNPKMTSAQEFTNIIKKQFKTTYDKLGSEEKKIWDRGLKELQEFITTEIIKNEKRNAKIMTPQYLVGAFENYVYVKATGDKLELEEVKALKIALENLNKGGLTFKDIVGQEKEAKLVDSEKVLNQLSQQQLAKWIVESAQAMLNTKDPHLAGVGEFVKQSLNNLALALMAKGAKLVIPEDKKIESHAFVKQFADSLVEKFSSLKDEKIPDSFWKGFVDDLPLPSFVKDLLLPHLIDGANSLQKTLQKATPDLEEVQKVYVEAKKTLLSYKGGEHLLSITEKITDQMVELVLGQNLELVSTLGLGDTIEELFVQYLPGVKINQELKTWFKENISALGVTEGESPKSIILFKQGVQAVLCKAMVNTIEKNFKNNGKDYATQLLKNIQQAFTTAFKDFDENQKKELSVALKIQNEIKEKKDSIEKLKKEMDKKPTDLTSEQATLLDNVIAANTRHIRAINYLNNLKEKREKVFADLNPQWELEDLFQISEALVKIKMRSANFSSTEELKKALTEEIKKGVEDADEMMLELLSLSAEKLKLLSELINIDHTFQHAKKEIVQLEKDLEQKMDDVSRCPKKAIPNQEKWKEAKKWMRLVLDNRQKIHALSQNIINLEKELDTHLGDFQHLAENLTALLGLDQKENLKLPSFLQDQVWPAIQSAKKQQVGRLLFAHLTPFLVLVVERDENRELLKKESGSDFLGHLCKSLSKDVFALLPMGVSSYRPIAKELFHLLSDRQPTVKEEEKFANEIAKLVKEKNVKNSSLVQAFCKLEAKGLTNKQQEDLKSKLEERKAKDAINQIVITPEEIAKSIGEMIHLDPALQKTFASELQWFLHHNPTAYQNISEFAGSYIEGVLLKMFIKIAQKNPKTEGKDTLIILTEKLLDIVTKKYQELKEGKKVEEVAKELNDAIMKGVLGIDSPEAFEGLPDSVKVSAYNAIKDQLGNLLLSIHKSLDYLEGGDEAKVKEAKEKVKKFGIKENATKGYVQILAEDIANMIMVATPHTLAEISGEKMKGVNVISKSIGTYLEGLALGNVEIGKVLLNYTQGNQFQQILENHLSHLADNKQLANDKEKVAHLLSNLLIVPLGQVIEKAINFEEKNKAEFNQKLMANVLLVGAEHLKNLNAAKEIAAKEGRKEINHQDFVKAVGKNLHSGVPLAPVTYQAAMDMIDEKLYGDKLTDEKRAIWNQEQDHLRQLIAGMVKQEGQGVKVIQLDDFITKFDSIHLRITGERLTEDQIKVLKNPNEKGLTLRGVIRNEAEAHNIQRQKACYGPAAKVFMKMLFPNGKKDLTFVPEELREVVWKAFKTNLFPQILPMVTELILDPATINSIVLGSLESAKETFSGKIDLEKPKPAEEEPKPADRAFDALDEASGELIVQVLKSMTLPGWMKNFMIEKDPKTGEIKATSAMKRALGASLRKQFNDTFIKDKLLMALEKGAGRDAEGNPVLKFDTRSPEVKAAEASKKAKKMQADLRRATREVVDVSISYFIRSTWAQAQARFDKLVEAVLGKIGAKMKKALDAVFRFVFFTIIGSILSVLFWPLKQLAKQIIYRVISLDKNREDLLGMLTKAPGDQPATNVGHVIYNENLIFRMGEVLYQTVKEAIDKEPIVPMAASQKEELI